MMTKLGEFERYKNIDFRSINRLVFVCAGNICRSPLAEAVASNAGIKSVSYGLHCRGGDKADPRAIAFALKNNLDLDRHVTQNIQQYAPQEGDLLVGMEPEHARALSECLGTDTRITLIGLWLPSGRAYIHDPYNANEIFFDRCESEVVNATKALISKMRCCDAAP